MNEFIDLHGASGRAYRFRLWREGEAHQPIAGNYVFVGATEQGAEVYGVGVTNDLSAARRALARLKRSGAPQIYTRLNVSRTARETEHQDLVAHYKPQFIGEDAT